MNTFPSNPAHSLIIADLAVQLQYIPTQGAVADMIRANVGTRPKEVIRMIQEQSELAPQEMADVIGWGLLDKIKNIEV